MYSNFIYIHMFHCIPINLKKCSEIHMQVKPNSTGKKELKHKMLLRMNKCITLIQMIGAKIRK